MANAMLRFLVLTVTLAVMYVYQTPMNFWLLTKKQFFTLLITFLIVRAIIMESWPELSRLQNILISLAITGILGYPMIRFVATFVINKILSKPKGMAVAFIATVFGMQTYVAGAKIAFKIAILSTLVAIGSGYAIQLNAGGDNSIVMPSPYQANPLLSALYVSSVTWTLMWILYEETF